MKSQCYLQPVNELLPKGFLREEAFYATTFRPILTAFLLIGKAYIQPRHYGGVFEIQKGEEQCSSPYIFIFLTKRQE